MLLPEHTCYDRYSLSSKYYELHAFYRKHFWRFSTFRTKNIHIYLVCCCQSTLATIDVPFRAIITGGTRFVENISGVFPHLERRMYTYILSVTANCYDRYFFSSDIPFRARITSRTRFICGKHNLLVSSNKHEK